MRKLLIFLSVAALTVAANTGCEVEADFKSPMVIDDIFVDPDGWTMALVDGRFDYYYCDIRLPEINDYVFNSGSYQTYWRYGDVREGQEVDVQEKLPAVINLDRFEDGDWVPYTEIISCSYEVGYVRIMISRSDFYNRPPDKRLYFRTVIFW